MLVMRIISIRKTNVIVAITNQSTLSDSIEKHGYVDSVTNFIAGSKETRKNVQEGRNSVFRFNKTRGEGLE